MDIKNQNKHSWKKYLALFGLLLFIVFLVLLIYFLRIQSNQSSQQNVTNEAPVPSKYITTPQDYSYIICSNCGS